MPVGVDWSKRAEYIRARHAEADTQSGRYEHARSNDLAETRDRIDALLAEGDLDSLVYPGVTGYDTGARAGYPSITVPAGYTEACGRAKGVRAERLI